MMHYILFVLAFICTALLWGVVTIVVDTYWPAGHEDSRQRVTAVIDAPPMPHAALPLGIIPLIDRNENLAVDVLINGTVLARVVIDSGATSVVVSRSIAQVLEVNGIAPEKRFPRSSQGSGWPITKRLTPPSSC
ncbi:hypothetical protein [Roseiarcus sp.]|uniref:hypothetical protein n=1 Tax=Roseiarcus sp. TaxID=1969460 RepID=UPI003F9D3D61